MSERGRWLHDPAPSYDSFCIMPQVRVADLFKAKAAFCSSTISESRPDRAISAPSQQRQSRIQDALGKRNWVEDLRDVAPSAKRLKSARKTLEMSRECCSLVGRLLLCNKKRHSWGGISAGGDCLAFTDSTGSICCSVSRDLDISFIGQLVRVNSWSFIPNDLGASTRPDSDQHMTKAMKGISHSNDLVPKGSSRLYAAKPQDFYKKNCRREASETGTDILDGRGAADGTGFLEIHSLELLEKQGMKVSTFPSLCVDPAAADIRNALFESPLMKKKEKRSRLTICGKLQSISPQFSLPCSSNDDRNSTETSEVASSSKDVRQCSNHLCMIGFLLELNYCRFCSRHYIDAWTMGEKKQCHRPRRLFEDDHSGVRDHSKHGVDRDQDDEHIDRRDYCHVYFSGSPAAWRPLLLGSIRHCVTISGLRRKLVLTGIGKNFQLLLVATRTSLVLPVVDPHHMNVRVKCIVVKEDSEGERADGVGDPADQQERCTHNFQRVSGRGRSNHPRVISYMGFVTSILFQGTLVELDKHVWLLLTHQGQSHMHGLRVGAMLALRDVHAVTIITPSDKTLLLGACIRSHVSVQLFSPLHSPPLDLLHTQSLLLRYMQKVSFASAFWILSLIGSFRQKFRGIYSDKELMGSKKDPGIILKYVQKVLAPGDTLERPDYFKEFLDHHHISCRGGSVAYVSLNKVPPISNLIGAALQCSRSKTRQSHTGGTTDFQRSLQKKRLLSSLDISTTRWQFADSIVSSQEMGVTLLGSLQVCEKSGQLQLMDSTGFVYVVVPDLSSSTDISRTYQISSFTLMVKELTGDSDITRDGRRDGDQNSSISWSSILKNSKAMLTSFQASELLVHFYMRDAELIDGFSFCNGMGNIFSQGLKRRRLNKQQSKETANMMELDLETLRIWLQQRMAELGTASNPTSHLRLLRDSSGGLSSPNELLRVSCKVVAVDLLLFEYEGLMPCKNRPSSESSSWPDHGLSDGWLTSLGIPLTLARVVVDDGCGLAHCWALGDAAVSLLGLLTSSLQQEWPPNLLARLGERYGKSPMQFTIRECMSYLVKRHGKIILRSERPYGASTETSYSLQWCGRESPDCDDQAFMQALVARACHNRPLVVTLGNIPPAVKDATESSKSPLEHYQKLAYWTGFQRSRSQENEWPQLFATKVESAMPLSDIRAVSDEIASLFENEL